MSRAIRFLPVLVLGASFAVACGQGAPASRDVLTGTSALVPIFHAAAAEHDVPAELLAGVSWAETAFIDVTARMDAEGHEGHAPGAAGVMGLPVVGAVRSVDRAAALLGIDPQLVIHDARHNVRGAAAILRSLADARFGKGALGAGGDRERWLEVAAAYFDAGMAGEDLALDVRRTIARGLEARDDAGETIVIPSYAELYDAPNLAKKRFAANGEYPNSTWVAADGNNYTTASRTGANIDVVVIHTTQGSYAGTISWFRNPSAQVTAHYVVRRSDGAITQMVRHKDIAWHAGNWSYNQRSIGIEHEGYVSDPNNYTDAQYRASADLTRWLCNNLGIPMDRSHIIGHVEVPGATHTDPGRYWDWDRYMSLVRGGSSMPPPSGSTGMLKGVVYVGGDTTNRIGGATIRVSPGGASATGRANDGYWEFRLAPGNYTITADLNGYNTGTVMRTVTAGADTWGSISITPAVVNTQGTLRGVVYDATKGDLNTHIPGATVRLSNGASTVVGADGVFIFMVAPGGYTVSAEKMGWRSASLMRTVTAGQVTWGSVGLTPEATMPTNRAPQTPALVSPIGGVTTRTPLPVFTVDGLSDPDGDAVRVEVELYQEEALTTRLSSGVIMATAQDRLISWRHPVDDLPRGEKLFWRARASDGRDASAWSAPAAFRTPDDGSASGGMKPPWTATILPGVGTNAPPGETRIVEPAADSTVVTVRPAFRASPATDPEGDALVYQFQVAADDLFEQVEARSLPAAPDPTKGPSWVAERDLAPGSRYYVRVRAADERVFGPWSVASEFQVAPDAVDTGDETPGHDSDMGGAPMIDAKVIEADSCATTRGAGADRLAPLAMAAAVMFALRRRRRAR